MILENVEIVNKRYRIYQLTFSDNTVDETKQGEGKNVKLPLPLSLLENNHLKEGSELEFKEISKLFNQSVHHIFEQRVADYVSIRSHSEKEIADYLKRVWYKSIRKYASKDLERVINLDSLIEEIQEKLKNNDLLDDEDFAKEFVQSRVNQKPRGKTMIVNELMQKGVSMRVAKNVVADEIPDESVVLEDLLMKKYRDKKIEQGDQKKIRYLQSKGFSWDTIRRFLQD